jgi:heme A synthase
MKALWRLALGADLVTFGTIMLGSWTRIHGAGLTCPDWPLCRGHLVPSMAGGTIWEWTHRLLAFCVAPLVALLVPAAWRKRSQSPFILPVTAAIAILFAVQVFLGAATVHLDNSPLSVVLHWGTAMAFVAALTAMTVFAAAAARTGGSPDALRASTSQAAVTVLGITALVAFATMCVGAYVSSSGAGLACLSIPECAGNVVVYTQGQEVQMLHRFFAAATLLCSAASLAVAWALPASARVRIATSLGVALVCLQIALGLLNVALRLPADLREAHAVNAAFVFLAFVVATLLCLLDRPGSLIAARSGAEAE